MNRDASADADSCRPTYAGHLVLGMQVATGLEEVTALQKDMVQPAELAGGAAAPAPGPSRAEFEARGSAAPSFITTTFTSRADYNTWIAAGCPPKVAAAAAP